MSNVALEAAESAPLTSLLLYFFTVRDRNPNIVP
jgi:hypothetical protein